MMIKWRYSVAVVALAVSASTARGVDSVKMKDGKPLPGNVIEMSALEVTIDGTVKRKIAVNEIESISFDNEPAALPAIRTAVSEGRYEDALALFKKIDPKDVKRREIKQDVDFYQAIIAARLALSGSGSKPEAGKQLLAFERANEGNYHYLEACEALGDLLVALDKHAQAEPYYSKLAKAPWPEYRMRAHTLVGRALAAQKKYDPAIAKFDEALAMAPDAPNAIAQLIDAQLGKAAALAGSGKVDEGIKMVEEVIKKLDEKQAELHAQAYNVLGNCYLAAGKKKEAMLAYLHVTVVFPGFSEHDAEALGHLQTLWNEVYNKNDKAEEARAELKQRFPNSSWAQD